MELRQLKYFVKLAETLNFSEASKSLFITQSTLSQQIKQLEQEFNAQLFQRNSHSVSLTEAGEELLPCAKETINAAETCAERIQDLQKLLTGTLNIGVTYSFGHIFTETLSAFMKQYPKVKVNVYYKPMSELLEMLKSRCIDFVLAYKPSILQGEIESHILFDSHISVIVKDTHPLALKKKISLSELEDYDLVMPAKGLQARNAFDKLKNEHPLNLKVRLEMNEVNMLLKLIKQSDFVTILSDAAVINEQGLKSIPIDVASNTMEGCVHMLKDSYRKHSAQEFIKMLGESNIFSYIMKNWL